MMMNEADSDSLQPGRMSDWVTSNHPAEAESTILDSQS